VYQTTGIEAIQNRGVSAREGYQIPGLDKVALGEDSVGVFQYFSDSIIPPMLHIHFSFSQGRRCYLNLAIYTVVSKTLPSGSRSSFNSGCLPRYRG
jgi:hypothetical protein